MQLFGHGTTSSDLRQQKGSETQAVETTAESFSDTESSESGESSLEFSDFAYSVRGGAVNPWTCPPHDQNDDDSADSDSFSGVYTSFDDETTDLRTSLYISDSERQRLLSNNLQAVVAELENRHRDDMQAYAVEVQALRDAQEALTKELSCTFESREGNLLREKAELQRRLNEVSDANATLSAESARLSLEVDNSSYQVQETRAMITQIEQDYADMVQSLQKTEASSEEDVSCLTAALDDALANAVRLRQELDKLNASVSQERSDLLDANNTLRSQLNNATHELEMERRSQSAAARSADKTLILTESRDSTELEQVYRKRDKLMNNLYLGLERERAETSRVSEEIHSLHQDRDDAYANEKEGTQRISSAAESKERDISIVHAKLATTQCDFELGCTLLTEDISKLEMERNALQVTVTMLEEEARDAQRQKDNDLQALCDEHDALLLKQTDELRAEMQTTIDSLQASLNAQIDEHSRQLRASEQSKEREIGSLHRERDELQRDLEATCTGRDQMSSDIRDLQARLNESQIKREKSKPDILEEPALSGSESELSNIRRQLGAAKEAIRSKSTQIEILQNENRAALQRKVTRETETLKTEMLAQINDLQAQKGELSRRVSEMTTALESKEARINSLREQRNNLKLERDNLKHELESIRDRTEFGSLKFRPGMPPIGAHILGGSESAGHPMPRQHPMVRPLPQTQLVNPFFTLEATSRTSRASWEHRASGSSAGGPS